MGYSKTTLIETSTDKTGEFTNVKNHQKILCVVEITGTANCSIDARQHGGDWKQIAEFTESGELNIDNYGWYEMRAVTSSMSSANVKATISWR